MSTTPPIANAAKIEQLFDQLADHVRKVCPDTSNIAFIGIRRRGDIVAAKIAERLGVSDVGSIDITLYRDDLSETGAAARVGKTAIPFSVEGREIILCDDVLMTGRSVLAALREILDFGRPARVRLAVLVERPEREIPIQPDFIALKIRPAREEKIDVRLAPQDDRNEITVNARS
ncbi:MAG TPA: bifunctional pyr operon transcriptional regulator/uracil phosphoribosyltransferase PyrR [Phycisphaerales bacterium]|nr:bifunctional pyr operon transcriptional regulator/uracil phosphoribosyltransferase PyrR [Phycisphaerales bacterium]